MSKNIVEIEIERKKKNKYGIIALQKTLNEFYRGIGYSKTAVYIKDNNYIEQIEFVIDNYDIGELLSEDPLKALSIIELMYIQKYMPISKKIYDFLVNYSEEKLENEMPKLIKFLSVNNFANCDDIDEYIVRFSKLKLISISEEDKKKICDEFTKLKNQNLQEKLEKQNTKSKVTAESTSKLQLNEHFAVIRKAYQLYNTGATYDDLYGLVTADPLTFYKYIINGSEQIENNMQDFAVDFASYVYNKSLIRKYEIDRLLLDITDEGELFNIIYNTVANRGRINIGKRIDLYISLSPTITQYEIDRLLRVKTIYYKFYKLKEIELDQLRKDNRENKRIELSTNLVINFMNSANSMDGFCRENKINRKTLTNAISLLKSINHPIYFEYISYYTAIKEEKGKTANEAIQSILSLIKSGVQVGDNTRSFDIFDYYSITDLTFSEMLELVKDKLSKSDYIILVNFMKNNISENNWGKEQINSVLSGTHILNVKLDKRKSYIPGSGIEVPLEYKLLTIETLNKLNVPLNNVTYHSLINRLMLGENIETIAILGSKRSISNEKNLAFKK